ncbi:MAG: ChaN family lipoprotein [Paracoccaceae bacterium]
MKLCRFVVVWVCILGAAAWADVPPDARQADVVFLGEVHDNPAHHTAQAEWVAELQPTALVFEMVPPAMAAGLSKDDFADMARLEAALGWADSGWPDFAMYYPIFAAADARIYGAAVPRATGREVMAEGPGAMFADNDVARFELNQPLPEDQQTKREALQMAAHCDALPEDLLSGMVTIQRVRDAALARAALQALQETGGPVAVITGNGHARLDWGAPAALRQAAPEVMVFALGQGEDNHAPDGPLDHTLDAPGIERGDPCAAFK